MIAAAVPSGPNPQMNEKKRKATEARPPTPLHEYSILTVSNVHLSQDVVICDDCKRLISRADAIQQSGLIFCYSKEDCCKHIVSSGGRGCRRNKP